MKPRARRVTIAAAALGAGVVAGIVVAPGPVRDHISAWRFQLTRETETAVPDSNWSSPRQQLRIMEVLVMETMDLLARLATWSGQPVIFDPIDCANEGSSMAWILDGEQPRGTADAVRMLEKNGWHVIEQHLPRRAYVVILDHHAREEYGKAVEARFPPPVPPGHEREF
jgi:hypothetical protein